MGAKIGLVGYEDKLIVRVFSIKPGMVLNFCMLKSTGQITVVSLLLSMIDIIWLHLRTSIQSISSK